MEGAGCLVSEAVQLSSGPLPGGPRGRGSSSKGGRFPQMHPCQSPAYMGIDCHLHCARHFWALGMQQGPGDPPLGTLFSGARCQEAGVSVQGC